MSDHSETIRALSSMTDGGAFERLAMAVLRQAEPSLYENLSHTGMNSDGKTVKSPVDGIGFVSGEQPLHMVAAHHASGKREDLKKKWLLDPAKVKQRPGTKTRLSAGDVIKTAEIVKQQRKQVPDLKVTLALTTNKEPPEELIRETVVKGVSEGIDVDIWSCSRIAHYLDSNPDGQWIRRTHLGISQERLSKQLLLELSLASLQSAPLMAQPELLISRELDNVLSDQASRPVTFVVGDSGFGKTAACYKLLKAHVNAGNYGIVLSHQTLLNHHSLNQAIDVELRNLHPDLEANAGLKARSFCSPDKPFLMFVEDVNWSENPAMLLERLTSWSQAKDSGDSTARNDWHLFCPVWPLTLATIRSQEAKKRVDSITVAASSFSESEARSAIQLRARQEGISLTSLEADHIAEALGNDPLHIALLDLTGELEPKDVIKKFVRDSLDCLANGEGSFTVSDYQMAFTSLANEMLLRNKINPRWQDVSEWLNHQSERLSALRQILKDGKIVRLIDNDSEQTLVFRHDRVRASILAGAATELIKRKDFDVSELVDPYLSDVLGAALAEANVSVSIAKQVLKFNPAALFFALRAFREPTTETHRTILKTIDQWLADENTYGRKFRTMRWISQQALAGTVSSHVLNIADKFRDGDWPLIEARLLNGDLLAGVELCRRVSPGCGAPWRDGQIENAKAHYGNRFKQQLGELLQQRDIGSGTRVGGLRLAGYFAHSELIDSIEKCWMNDIERVEHLDDYLWAASMCCGEQPERLLDPICDAWAGLPDERENREDQLRPSRFDIAAHEVSWAFRNVLPDAALHYFSGRTKDEKLSWPITYMLRGVDHPDAVEFIARECSSYYRESEELGGFAPFPGRVISDWRDRFHNNGKRMSLVSRQRLQLLWENPENDKYLRCQSLRIWAAVSTSEDIDILTNIKATDSLGDELLRARLRIGDTSAIPSFIDKIKSDAHGYWWQLGRHIWTDELTNELEAEFNHRRAKGNSEWGKDSDTDWIISELLMGLEPEVAQSLLSKHWDYLQYSPRFVQAALFLATPMTRELAENAISNALDKKEMFKFIDHHFGIKVSNHPQVKAIRQLEALIPYLDLIGSHAIYSFWEYCNGQGWFNFRRKYLDNRLDEQSRKNSLLDEETVYSELDLELERGHADLGRYWYDRHSIEVEQNDVIFNILGRWLNKRKSIAALEFVASVLVHADKRSDIDLLRVGGIEPSSEADDIIADTRFAICQRSPS